MLNKPVLIITSLLFLGACGHGPVEKQSGARDTQSPDSGAAAAWQPPEAIKQQIRANEWAVAKHADESQKPAEAGNVSYDNIWDRIRAGMILERDLKQPAVRSKLQWYSDHQAYLNRVADRARPYIHHIVEELEARNMPLELALLPVVESAYQPLAYSRSHAAGIWQFIPATGRRYGLKQNWWYDGRRDITAATRAALDYLQFLHNEFNGNWQHAVAAYNCGENNVHRAIARNRAAGRPTDFWNLSLPRETRGYVPALLAISELVASPKSYGVTLKPIANEPYFTKVVTGGQIDLNKAARLAGIDPAEMKRLNPGFKRWATDPDGPHHLLIPRDRADRFAQAVNSLPKDQRLTWRQHRIQRGETLAGIARRYGTTVAVLQRSNNIRGHLIRAGQHLVIPAPGAENETPPADMATHVAQQSQDPQSAALHTVRRGDTLWTIARRYGSSVSAISTANQLNSSTVLRPGQKLRLPAGTTRQDNGRKVVRYTVRQGDSLWTISQRFQVPLAALRQWNQLSQTALLQPGQELQLYVDANQPHGI